MVCLLIPATNHGTLAIHHFHSLTPPTCFIQHYIHHHHHHHFTVHTTLLSLSLSLFTTGKQQQQHTKHQSLTDSLTVAARIATPTNTNHTVAKTHHHHQAVVHDPPQHMASACVNNIGVPPENFPYGGWLSPRLSFSGGDDHHKSGSKSSDPTRDTDPEPDFEFRRLDGPVAMLPADQLFSDGKLVPLNIPSLNNNNNTTTNTTTKPSSPENSNPRRKIDSDSSAAASSAGSDPYIFSPKAPRCSSRWKELLGLKKLYQSANGTVSTKTTSSSSSSSSSKSLKLFLHRGASKTASFSSENAPLLMMKDHSDCESLSISSSRLSLSSSSSGHEHDDLPRLSLDSEKPNPNPNPNPNPISLHRNPNPTHHPRIRMVKPRANSFDSKPGASDPYSTNRAGRSPIRRAESGAGGCRGVSVDSPRMNSSGKIVFQSLERSSSSPSSFNNGGPRFKQRGMERSYSANVRVTPVLNVPVCSLRGSSKSGSVFGFGQLFGSPQKKEGSVGSINGGTGKGRNRSDRN